MASVTNTANSNKNVFVKVRSKFVLKDSKASCSNIIPYRSSFFENVEPKWFNNLPIKILLNIFQYFSEEELRKCILPVCQHWKYAAQQPVLWKKLVFRGKHVPLHFISKQLRMYTEAESILIDNITEAATVIRQICRCTPNIKFLAIRYCTSVPETAIRFIISSCSNLEGLDLCGSHVNGSTIHRWLNGLNRLKKLNLSDCPHLYVKPLISVILNCPYLEDLRISKFSNKRDTFMNADAVLILSNLSENLKFLSLDCTSLSSTSIQKVFECKKLERLGLIGATNLTGTQVMSIWLQFPNLKQLKIRNAYQIADVHVIHLFTCGRSVMTHLVYLDLAGCFKISDESVTAIANCCEYLQHLGLKCCKSISNIKPLLERNPKLNTLNIAFMSLLNIDKWMPFPKYLKKLLIDDSRLLDDWFINFQKNNKDVRVLVCQSEYNKHISNINVITRQF
ncbi:F-box-like [Popillia japonica]|uniref:F-box-like n=1 Tax=Popillia japonica TaxID=7064 RepID=A0AAW1KSA4_POPJA